MNWATATPEQRARKVASERARRAADPLRKRKRMAQRSSQPAYVAAQCASWRRENPERYLELGTAAREIRQTRIAQATPPWLNGDQKAAIAQWYSFAKMIGYEVDHIVPLKGVDEDGNHVISGLHVPWNLQTLSPTENRRKANKFAPRLVIGE